MSDRRLAPALLLVAVGAAGCESPEPQLAPPVWCERSVEEWVGDLREGDVAKREAAVRAIEAMGPDALPYVVPELDDNDRDVRFSAVTAMLALDRHAAPYTAAIAARVDDPDPGVRAQAAWLLGRIGKGARDAAPALHDALFDTDAYVRWRAAVALETLGRFAYDAVEDLERLSHHDKDWRVRDAAASARRVISDDHHRWATARDAGRSSSE